LNHLIPLLDEEVKPRTNSSAQQFFKNVTAANFRLQHLSPHLTQVSAILLQLIVQMYSSYYESV
jgi:hypothetical protein